jgi:soluble lytic murein transglycosylase-like protein
MASNGMVRLTWGRGARRAIACGAIAAAAIAREGTAAADVFRYVDRDGVAHRIDVAGAAPAVSAPSPSARTADGEYPFAGAVQEAARIYSLPVELLLAVMTIESGFDPKAVSPRGAMGLMQVMPATAADVQISDPFDPRENILGGARHLRILLNGAAGDVTLALGSYNAGAGASQRYGGVPPFRDTHRYVASVIRFYRMYQTRGTRFAAEVAAAIRGKRGAVAPARIAPKPAAIVEEQRVASPPKAVAHDNAKSAGPRTAPGLNQARPRRPKRPRRGDG